MNLLLDIVKKDIPFCVPQTRTPDMLYLMKKYNLEDLLVVNNMHDLNLLGIVHQTAISDMALKKIIHPFDLKAETCMETNIVSISQNASIDDCLKTMEANHLDLIPVIDQERHCVGIVLKKDISDKLI